MWPFTESNCYPLCYINTTEKLHFNDSIVHLNKNIFKTDPALHKQWFWQEITGQQNMTINTNDGWWGAMTPCAKLDAAVCSMSGLKKFQQNSTSFLRKVRHLVHSGIWTLFPQPCIIVSPYPPITNKYLRYFQAFKWRPVSSCDAAESSASLNKSGFLTVPNDNACDEAESR